MCKRKAFGESSMGQVLCTYRVNAKKQGRVFELSREQAFALFAGDCHYCGAAPALTLHRKGGYGFCTYNGIDRIDNDVGYVPGNVVSCCATCNYRKGRVTDKQFLAWALEIARKQGWTNLPSMPVQTPHVLVNHPRSMKRRAV